MAEVFPVYTTAELVQVVPNLKLSQNFLLRTFFPNSAVATTEEIAIDVDVGKRRLAPFVSPLVEGKIVEGRRVQTNLFKPAYIKDKRVLDVRRPIRRAIGERVGGQLTPAERYMANIRFEMDDAVDMIDRRMEWMAAQALMTGTVTVKGDGFPTTLIDFGRDASLTVALAGAAQWGQTGVLPSWNINEWQNQILKMSGAVATELVFTPSAWEFFLQDPVVKNAWLFAGNGGQNVVNVGAELPEGGGAVLMGRWGRYNLWQYNDWYVDPDTDAENPMIPDGTFIMCGKQMMGTRAFGVIYDPAFNYGPLPYAPKMWVEQDPAQTIVMVQSAPLVIPSRVNACLCATVCPAVLT